MEPNGTALNSFALFFHFDVWCLIAYAFPPLQPPLTLWAPHSCLRPVVEGDSSGRLLLAEEGRRLDLGVAEAQVFMEVVKAIDKVAHMTA